MNRPHFRSLNKHLKGLKSTHPIQSISNGRSICYNEWSVAGLSNLSLIFAYMLNFKFSLDQT